MNPGITALLPSLGRTTNSAVVPLWGCRSRCTCVVGRRCRGAAATDAATTRKSRTSEVGLLAHVFVLGQVERGPVPAERDARRRERRAVPVLQQLQVHAPLDREPRRGVEAGRQLGPVHTEDVVRVLLAAVHRGLHRQRQVTVVLLFALGGLV